MAGSHHLARHPRRNPAVHWLDIAHAAGDPREIAEAVLIAGLQLFLIAGVMRPLESLFPAERWSDRRLTTVDRNYTLLMLLGLFPLFSFLVLMPFASMLGGGPAAEEATGLKHWVPWFADHPVALFLVYYVVYDLVYYWMHRAQHVIPWWWAMHSMHHSQRQMSCWSNDRSHYLDGMLQSFILATVGLAMGVEPSEFALLGLLSELVQNFRTPMCGCAWAGWAAWVSACWWARCSTATTTCCATPSGPLATTAILGRCCPGGTCCLARRCTPTSPCAPRA